MEERGCEAGADDESRCFPSPGETGGRNSMFEVAFRLRKGGRDVGFLKQLEEWSWGEMRTDRLEAISARLSRSRRAMGV